MHFDPIPMTYTELLPQLMKKSLIAPVPAQPMQPMYPKWFDLNAKCEYHGEATSYSTENCRALKVKVQGLINAKWLVFQENAFNVGQNPLPSHRGPRVNVVESSTEEIIYTKATDVKTPIQIILNQCARLV